MAKVRDFVFQITCLSKTLSLIWEAAGGWLLAWAMLLIVQGVLPGVTVYLTALLVDRLASAIGAGGSWKSIQPLLLPACLVAGVTLILELLRGASEWVRITQAEFIQDYIKSLIHKKSTTVDLNFYESPDYYDRLHQVQSDAGSRPLALLENIGSLLQNSITLLTMATLLLSYGLWLPFVLVISTLPAFYVSFRLNHRHHGWWEKTTVERRWVHYYDTMLCHSTVAAELRLFGFGSHFQSAYQAWRGRLRVEHLRLARDQTLARLRASIIAMMTSGVAMTWMAWQALRGLVSLGDLALFFQAFYWGQGLMRSLLGTVGQIYGNSLFLRKLFEFLELEAKIAAPANPIATPINLKQDIGFRQVTFCYPGSERAALQNFNLTIPAGQIVAVVGSNGAGKSTLLKLLCRFYDPGMGSVEVDGIDIRNLSPEELRRKISVLFQSPVAYHATAGENIALGDLSEEPSLAEIESAARGAGAHEVIARLPRGYNTLLGKSFCNGTELSGGEWQRIALARTFLRRAPIVVLDEPTSSMDSWAEAEWLARFRTVVRGRTVIIITHRFTTARHADVIHVMNAGRIVESGTHDELLARGELYACSWFAQVQDDTALPSVISAGTISHTHLA